MSPNRDCPPGYGKGNFVPLGLLEYRKAYATMLQAVAGDLRPCRPAQLQGRQLVNKPYALEK
jgi:hypothetical protein